jgi:hypothetical protein
MPIQLPSCIEMLQLRRTSARHRGSGSLARAAVRSRCDRLSVIQIVFAMGTCKDRQVKMRVRPRFKTIVQLAILGVLAFVGLRWIASVSSPEPTVIPASEAGGGTLGRDLRIVTLLPKDAIPAIFDPEFLSAGEADAYYDPNELILGVEIDGDARAYSIPLLSRHEIVNDTVGGRKIAVTW